MIYAIHYKNRLQCEITNCPNNQKFRVKINGKIKKICQSHTEFYKGGITECVK